MAGTLTRRGSALVPLALPDRLPDPPLSGRAPRQHVPVHGAWSVFFHSFPAAVRKSPPFRLMERLTASSCFHRLNALTARCLFGAGWTSACWSNQSRIAVV